ncbi:MAG: hypothetical protein NZ583_01465 [Desulfobacterota bacterium]|nr:hypothetical protein [Thermodesulfobacteriota bacterium]MDW8001383.1 hypothetical protein [Deltaproteobacteria bacterium]
MIEKIKELNQLWEPVFPYLAQFAATFCSSYPERIAEMGPFCGVIYEFSKSNLGTELYILSFPEGMDEVYRDEVKQRGLKNIKIISTTFSLEGIQGEYFDFIFFRGAFFFPSIFEVDLLSIYRVLKRGGTAVIGGGFGKDTPPEIIESIKPKSKILNSQLKRINVSKDEVVSLIKKFGLNENARVSEEGGIWIELKRSSP